MKRVLIYLADGFEECEGLIAVDILRRAGLDVTTVSITNERLVEAKHEIRLYADKTVGEVDVNAYDAVVLPGGIPGTPNLAACTAVTDTCVKFAQEGKLVCAICAAPGILGGLGLLKGRRATVYPGMEDTLPGAIPAAEEVVVDGNFITGRSMGTAIPFALTIVAQLLGRERAQALAADICYTHF